jgi:hypothetical protein
MKNFKDICRMRQPEVKAYMEAYLAANNYSPISEDGFLYAKGDVPVLLVAHMDTVHKNKCTEIVEKDGKISSPQGIGGDDRCGVFMIMNVIKEHHCSVLLCEDEEIGCVGASKFCKTEYIKDLGVNYMIEFDRKGSTDAVYYSCVNKDFETFVNDNTGYKSAFGSFSDISRLAPAAKVAAVNLSCGYYKAHTLEEYVVYDEMMETIEAAKNLITAECDVPFEYRERKEYMMPKNTSGYNNYNYNSNYAYGDNYSLFDDNYMAMLKMQRPRKKVEDDTYLELEVVAEDTDGNEFIFYAKGKSKADCWADLFLTYTHLSYDAITDYSFV